MLKGAGINESKAPSEENNVDLSESLDLGSMLHDKTEAEVSIDAAADAFVESDENLN